MGVSDDVCRVAILFSLGRSTTRAEIDAVLDLLRRLIPDRAASGV